MRQLVSVLFVTLLLAATGLSVAATPVSRNAAVIPLSEINNREILVQFAPERGARSVSQICEARGVSHVATLPLSYARYEIVRVPDGQDYDTTLASLTADPQVAVAWPNVIKHVSEFIPNDPLFLGSADNAADGLKDPAVRNDQWGLLIANAQDAWDITTGRSEVVVADLDTGANLSHEDLVNRLWTNPDEIPGNGIDDDQNGYIDDIHGWNFHNNTNGGEGDPDDPNDPTPGNESHGMSTASIIGAQGNNGKGIMGVAGGNTQGGGIRLMILRVGTNSNIPVSAEIAAMDYAIANGAKVISMSFGGVTGGQPEEDAVDRAWNAGLYLAAAAGNIGAGNENPETHEPLIDLPAGFDNCAAVGATTVFDGWPVRQDTPITIEQKADYSKTGPELDIVAPGTHIMAATNVPNGYTDEQNTQFTGTSAATPLVSGLAALVWSANANLSNAEVRDAINNNAWDLGVPGFDVSFGNGRIDINNAVRSVVDVLVGDTNGDNIVNASDVQPIIANFGSTHSTSTYNFRIDTNGDGVIDELDLFEVGRHYGETVAP